VRKPEFVCVACVGSSPENPQEALVIPTVALGIEGVE